MICKFSKLRAFSWKETGLTASFSLLAWPVTYAFNKIFLQLEADRKDIIWLICGTVVLLSYTVVARSLLAKKDWIIYPSILFSFTAIVDLIISLEINGNITGFMTDYLKHGEPYLNSSFGFAVSVFDPIFFLPMYLSMVFCICNRINYKWIGLYWSGGLICSMFVEVFGIMTGPGPTFATLLNIPYVVVPVIAIVRLLRFSEPLEWHSTDSYISFQRTPIQGGIKLMMFAFTLFTLLVTMAFGLGSRERQSNSFTLVTNAIPSIGFENPDTFGHAYPLFIFFYLCPVYVLYLYYCFSPQKPQILFHICLVQAGVVLQGQFIQTTIALYKLTASEYQSRWDNGLFWLAQSLQLIVPQLQIIVLFLTHVWGPRELTASYVNV